MFSLTCGFEAATSSPKNDQVLKRLVLFGLLRFHAVL